MRHLKSDFAVLKLLSRILGWLKIDMVLLLTSRLGLFCLSFYLSLG